MKKRKFIAAFAVAAFAAVNVYHATVGSSNLSDLQLTNLEALAQQDEPDGFEVVTYFPGDDVYSECVKCSGKGKKACTKENADNI